MSGGLTGQFDEDPSTGRVVIPQGLIDAIHGNEFGGLGKSLDRNYTGDAANNRVIDLGDDYELVFIFGGTSKSTADNHGAMAHAARDYHGAFFEFGGAGLHSQMSGVDTLFQGKLTAGDANKIKLGSSGASAHGFNAVGTLYRILAFKFFDAKS